MDFPQELLRINGPPVARKDYRDTLDQELEDIRNSNLGKAATAVRLKREREGQR